VDEVAKIMERYDYDASQLISMLHDTQAKFNYLPKEALEFLSEKLKVPLPEVYRIATFYKAFSLNPKGKYHVKVCLGTACHVRGSQRILEQAELRLGIKNNETRKDGLFSLESVNCLGCCAIGPVIMVNEEFIGNVKTSQVERILKKYGDDR